MALGKRRPLSKTFKMIAALVGISTLIGHSSFSTRHFAWFRRPLKCPDKGLRAMSTASTEADGPGIDVDALFFPGASSTGIPGLSRDKGDAFDAAACQEAADALAQAVQKGNQNQFDGLVLALKLMMPAASGAEKAVAKPKDDFILRPEELPWSNLIHFRGGLEENMRIVQDCEAQFARKMAATPEGFRSPRILAAAMDLAVVYLKNYALDKCDALYHVMEPFCMARGLPWDVKWFQDCATLRCKQHRQAEAAPLLEEVAKRTPPHEATLRNLGTVYNQLRQHDKAKIYFDAAAELVGRVDKEDLWNIGLVHKNKKEYDQAAPMLEEALQRWLVEDPNDDVTLAKLYDSVGSCYDEMGRHDDAVDVLAEAKMLYNRSIGTESPLYGSACERLTRALVHAGRYQEGLDNLIEAFTVIALQDAVHPTPLFELLGIALEEIPLTKGVNMKELARLEVPIQAAVRNMHYRALDRDGNCGVLFERMARALVLCSTAAQETKEEQDAAARRRATARALLKHAAPLVAAATRDGLADLTHVTMLIDTELQALDSQDAAARLALSGNLGDFSLPPAPPRPPTPQAPPKQQAPPQQQAPAQQQAPPKQEWKVPSAAAPPTQPQSERQPAAARTGGWRPR
jgi:tetratricopeptide (TPR) repeat protein